MMRFEIIAHLIRKRGYKKYLEIGVLGKETFDSLPPLEVKHSVDPNGQAIFNMTSDEFFSSHCNETYDIIFIDGLHLEEQVKKDIENSLTHLNKGGIIVVHDCLPSAEYEQLREWISGKPWTGDVWKAFATMRFERTDLMMYVVDTDYGCGLIERRADFMPLSDFDPVAVSHILGIKPLDGQYTWDFFVKHRSQIMGVITVEEFLGHW
jgi:hypothetical protein